MSCPVLIRGQLYPSIAAAARGVGVGKTTITKALESGTLEFCGLGRNYRRKIPVEINGVRYESIWSACLALGLSERQVRKHVKFDESGNPVERIAA